MSILGRILSKIFPGDHPAVQAGGAGTTPTAPTSSTGGTAATPAAATADSGGKVPADMRD